MWNRREIKTYAKGFLRQSYWKAFLVVLITTFLLGGTSAVGKSPTLEEYQIDYNDTIYERERLSESFDTPSRIYNFTSNIILSPLAMIGIGIATVTSIFMGILLLTLGFVAVVGQSRFFLDGFNGDINIRKLFSGFNSEEYIYQS